MSHKKSLSIFGKAFFICWGVAGAPAEGVATNEVGARGRLSPFLSPENAPQKEPDEANYCNHLEACAEQKSLECTESGF